MPDSVIMDGVKEYCEGMKVSLTHDAESGRYVVEALNESGSNSTQVDLQDLIIWLYKNRPELVNFN